MVREVRVARWKPVQDPDAERAATYRALDEHVQSYFGAKGLRSFLRGDRPLHLVSEPRHLSDRFHVWEIAPRAEKSWTYVSVGAFEGRSDARLEFMLITHGRQTKRAVELLSMTAHYHAKEQLGLGHTFRIGEPWLPGATCGAMLISLPYVFDRKLEICNAGDGHVHILWALPITEAELRFRHDHSLEALEQRFEDGKLDYTDPRRASVL